MTTLVLLGLVIFVAVIGILFALASRRARRGVR